MKIDYLVLAFVMIGCGLSDPKVVVYENPDQNSADATGQGSTSGGGTDEDLGLVAFQETVAQAAGSACAACHASTPISGKKLVNGNDGPNRQTLLSYMGSSCDSDKLFEKLSSDKHGGGDQSDAMPESKINEWVSKDPDCK